VFLRLFSHFYGVFMVFLVIKLGIFSGCGKWQVAVTVAVATAVSIGVFNSLLRYF
jgi:hypothetical protein